MAMMTDDTRSTAAMAEASPVPDDRRFTGDPTIADDFPTLCRLREALEMFWRELRAGPTPAPGDADMCGITSTFLLLVLRDRGETDWHLRAGCASLFHDDEVIDQELGYFDGRRWHSHIWLQRGDHVLDMTAAQFGGPAVLSQRFGRFLTDRYRGHRLEGDTHHRLIAPMVPLAGYWAEEWRQIERIRTSTAAWRRTAQDVGVDAEPIDAPSP